MLLEFVMFTTTLNGGDESTKRNDWHTFRTAAEKMTISPKVRRVWRLSKRAFEGKILDGRPQGSMGAPQFHIFRHPPNAADRG